MSSEIRRPESSGRPADPPITRQLANFARPPTSGRRSAHILAAGVARLTSGPSIYITPNPARTRSRHRRGWPLSAGARPFFTESSKLTRDYRRPAELDTGDDGTEDPVAIDDVIVPTAPVFRAPSITTAAAAAAAAAAFASSASRRHTPSIGVGYGGQVPP